MCRVFFTTDRVIRKYIRRWKKWAAADAMFESFVQCRAAGGMHEEETWRRAAPENESPIIVRTPWIVARRWRANNDPTIDRPSSRPANF